MSEEATQKRQFCWTCGHQIRYKVVPVGYHPDDGARLYTDRAYCPNKKWWELNHYKTEEDQKFANIGAYY